MVQPRSLPTGNRLLDLLPGDERDLIVGAMQEVWLERRDRLWGESGRIETVCFPVASVVSLLVRAGASTGVEVATIGNEGLVGIALSWGADRLNPAELIQVQVPGKALLMDATAFTARLSTDSGFAGIVRRYTQAFFSLLSQQVACNALHGIEERCARWMLLTHDRVGDDEFPLTQEFLAQMLGVRRASVTAVAGSLQHDDIIRYRRGRLQVTDRARLEAASCECYQVLREVFERLLPRAKLEEGSVR